MNSQIDEAVARALTAWVGTVRERSKSVAALILLATLVLGGFTALNLGVNSDNVRLVGEDLPSRRNHEAFASMFPNLENALLIVVDGETPEITRTAADRLREALEGQPDRYRDVYVPGGGEFFERNGLLYRDVDDLDRFGDEMARVQPILAELESDPSLSNLASLIEAGLGSIDDDPEAEQWSAILDQVSGATQAIYLEYPLAISWESLLLRGSAVDVIERRVIIVHPVLDFTSFFAAGEAMESIHQTASDLGLTPEKGIRVRVTGNPALNYEEMFHIAWDVIYAGGFCFLVVVGILYLALRSVPLVLSVVVTLLAGLIWTAAFATGAIGHLNLVSMSFGVLFIGLGVDFAIHLCMSYADRLRSGDEHPEAILRSVQDVGGSLVLCAITTALGFYVFVPTDYRGIAELGLIAGTGMFIILFLTLTLLPALLHTWMPLHRQGLSADVRFRHHWWRGLEAHPKAVTWAAVVLALGAAALVPKARFDPNVVAMRDPSTESVQAFNELLSDATTSPWFVNSVAEDSVAAARLAERLRELETVSQTLTLDDYIPADQEEKLDILADIAFFMEEPIGLQSKPEPSGPAEQIEALRDLRDRLARDQSGHGTSKLGASMRLLEERLDQFLSEVDQSSDPTEALRKLESVLLSSLPEQLKRLRQGLEPEEIHREGLPPQLVQRMITPDGKARIQIFPTEDLSDEGAMREFVDEVMSLDPKAAGVSVNLVEFGRAIQASFRQALISAILAILTLLWLLWRRASLAMLATTPILVASLLTVAVMVILDLPFNFANVIVIPLIMGVGIDSGIHLVHRALSDEPGQDLMESTTARAVFFSAMTTVVSFGSLAFSSHRGLANMGITLSVGMLLTIVANLVVLPALLALRRQTEQRRADRGA